MGTVKAASKLTENEKVLLSSTNDFFTEVIFPPGTESAEIILEHYSKATLTSSDKITSYNYDKKARHLLLTGEKFSNSQYNMRIDYLADNNQTVRFNISYDDKDFETTAIWSYDADESDFKNPENTILGIFSSNSNNRIPAFNDSYLEDEKIFHEYISQIDETFVIRCEFK